MNSLIEFDKYKFDQDTVDATIKEYFTNSLELVLHDFGLSKTDELVKVGKGLIDFWENPGMIYPGKHGYPRKGETYFSRYLFVRAGGFCNVSFDNSNPMHIFKVLSLESLATMQKQFNDKGGSQPLAIPPSLLWAYSELCDWSIYYVEKLSSDKLTTDSGYSLDTFFTEFLAFSKVIPRYIEYLNDSELYAMMRNTASMKYAKSIVVKPEVIANLGLTTDTGDGKGHQLRPFP